MKLLDESLQANDLHMLVRNLTVTDFYYFFGFLKEVLPVMNLIADKRPNSFLEKKLSEIHD